MEQLDKVDLRLDRTRRGLASHAELRAVRLYLLARRRAPQQRNFFKISQRDSDLIGKQCKDTQCDAEDYPVRGPDGRIDQRFAVVAERMIIEILRVPKLRYRNPERGRDLRAAFQDRRFTFDSIDEGVEQHQALATC
jgi:hypothetical protein